MGFSMIPVYEKEDQKKRLQWLMFFRVIIATFFLGMAAITHLQKEDTYFVPYLVYIYVLIGSIYVITVIYIVFLFVAKSLTRFINIQILIDVLLITMLIFITGGRSSIYPFMYSISIISVT